MSNLALSRIRTGIAAAVAEERDIAVKRKADLLLGPTPWQEQLGGLEEPAKAVAAPPAPTMVVTSTGRRVKVPKCSAAL
jgi:hypothetical protein